MIGRRAAILLGVATAVATLDQLTKGWIVASVARWESIPVIPGFFDIVHTHNRGVAFGMFNNLPESMRILFLVALAVAIVIGLIWWAHNNLPRFGDRIAVACIVGGAIGNLVDRIRIGEVVDFLDVYLGSHHWPAFNVADSAITVGAGVLMAVLLRRRKERTEAN